MIFHQKQNTFGTKHFSYYIYENTIWDKHFHKDFEIIYIISGNIQCQIGDICCILSTFIGHLQCAWYHAAPFHAFTLFNPPSSAGQKASTFYRRLKWASTGDRRACAKPIFVI